LPVSLTKSYSLGPQPYAGRSSVSPAFIPAMRACQPTPAHTRAFSHQNLLTTKLFPEEQPVELPTQQAAKHALSIFDEFKNFAFKGNVVDLAVGVIIGGAFGKIITSMVDNIIMPVVGVVLPGNTGYENWALTFGEKTIPYGKFLGDVVSFLILAAALFFFIVKFLGWLMKQKLGGPPAPTADQVLLTEIRDLLKQQAR